MKGGKQKIKLLKNNGMKINIQKIGKAQLYNFKQKLRMSYIFCFETLD